MVQKSFFAIFNVLVIGMLVMAATPNDNATAEKPSVREVPSQSKLVGFKDWKQKRVFKARAALDDFKTQNVDPNANKGATAQEADSAPAPATNGEESGEEKQASTETQAPSQAQAPAVDKKQGEMLRQLEFNLEIALGLTIHDYFALYLKNKSKDEMVEAVQKLSPEEVSELMLAYKNSLYGNPKAETSKENPQNQKL